MKIPQITTRRLMGLVAIAALLSFFVTETWRRRRYHHCMSLAARHATDEAFLLAQATKWKNAVGVAAETARKSETVTDGSTGRALEAEEQLARLKRTQRFYELQAAHHAHESRAFRRAAERPWEAVPAESSYFPDSNQLYRQAARMR